MPGRVAWLAAGLDCGSARTRCVIVELMNARVRMLGYGEAPSHGWKKGRIADHDSVSESVLFAVHEAEKRAGAQIGSVVLGIGGSSICGGNGRGGYDIGFPRQITQGDINRVVDRASRVQLQDDEMLLHLMPQDFAVDGSTGLRTPRDIIGSRLEVHVHLVTTSSLEHQALVGAVNAAHLLVEETVFEPLAAAYASILPEERREGALLVDIGAHSTDLVVFYGEALAFSASLPICGDHFTRDVARGLLVAPEDAEWIKEQHGCAVVSQTPDNSLLELPTGPGRGAREATRKDLNTILEARAIDLFEYVERRLEEVGLDQLLTSAVLAGGGARLHGMCDVAEKELCCQARNGLPAGILDWPPEIDNPAWTVAAGLAMYSARLKLRAELDRKQTGFLSRVFGG